jgi:excisionase family DNA binding protein
MEHPNRQSEEINQIILDELRSLKSVLVEKHKPFLNIDQASEYLGIPKNTLYGYTSKGIIPFYKPQGRRLYFCIDDLDKFVLDSKNRVSSMGEIEEKAVTKIVV